jgi:transcriptional regulator with XRE-family HTH domain
MRLSELKTSKQVLRDQLRDPAFRAEWERTALARAVAQKVLAYRIDHGLSQRALAGLLGVSQPQVARLEAGDHNPTIDTLVRLAQAMDLEFTIDVHPRRREPKLINKRAQTRDVLVSYECQETAVLFAAG